MQPARASAVAAVVFASVGLLGSAAALTYAHRDTSQDTGLVADKDGGHGQGHGQEHGEGQAKGHDKTDKTDKADGKNGDNGAAGRAHADAMKAWARCVAEAASGPKADGAEVPPKTACGDKPVGPGRAKHANAGAPGKSGEHKPAKTHGKSGSH
jgi:hypothetical protein